MLSQDLIKVSQQLKRILKILGSSEVDNYDVAELSAIVQDQIELNNIMLEKENTLQTEQSNLLENQFVNETLRTMIETMPAGIVVANADGKIIMNNILSQELLGGPVEGSIDKPIRNYTVYYPDGRDFPANKIPLWRALHEGKVIKNVELLLRYKHGGEKIILSSAAPIYDLHNEIVSSVVIFQDISEIKKAQKEQKTLNEMLLAEKNFSLELSSTIASERDILTTIMENTHAQLALLDKNFNFIQVNQSYSKGCSYSKDYLIGKNHFSLFPNQENKSIFQKVVDTGTPVFFHAKPFISPSKPEEGTTYWDWSLIPVKEKEDTVNFLVFSLIDVTELEKTKQLLEEEQTRLQTIIENIPAGIVVMDQKAEKLTVNPSAMEIFNGLVDQRSTYNKIFPFDSDSGIQILANTSPLEESIKRKKVIKNITIPYQKSKGDEHFLLVDAAPITNPQGDISGSVGVFQDISEKLALQKLLNDRNRDLALLNHLGRELTISLKMKEVIRKLLDATQELIDCQGCMVWLSDEKQPEWLVCKGATSNYREILISSKVHLGESLIGWVAQHGNSVMIADTGKDDRYEPKLEAETGAKTKSLIAVPLKFQNRNIGVLEVISTEADYFDQHEKVLLEMLANTAVIAIQNANFFQKAQEDAVISERAHLARELHDAVSQTLFSASVIAESLPRLWDKNPQRVREGLDQLHLLSRGALAEMRTLLLELRPQFLEQTDLKDLLQQLVESLRNRSKIEIFYEHNGITHLPKPLQIVYYRIGQEALQNVIKHAQAKTIIINLKSTNTETCMQIKDDGQGFDSGKIAPGHLGVIIMQERAKKANIDLNINSVIGEGTTIRAVWHNPDGEIQDGKE